MTCVNNESTADFPTDKVLRACEQYLEFRKRHLERSYQRRVKQAMWKRRFFIGRHFTEEEAREFVDESIEWAVVRRTGRDPAMAAERLLMLANAAQAMGIDTVRVAAGTAFIFDFID